MKKKYWIFVLTISLILIFGFFTPFLLIDREDDMGNNKSFKFVDLEITSAKLPIHTHLFLELSNGHLLLVDSTSQTDLLISDDKCANWDTVDTGDFTSGKITRAKNIVAAKYDRTNGYVYFMDWTTGDDITIWYLDLSDYSINVVGADIGDANYLGCDIFIRDGNLEIMVFDTDTDLIEVYRWQDPNWTFKANQTYVNVDIKFSFGTVVGTDYWFWVARDDGANWSGRLFKFTGTLFFISLNPVTDVKHPSGINQYGIAYDGTDYLFFIWEDVDDNKDYLFTYSITGDTITQLAEYNIAIMLDRNCVNTAPNEMEKAFDIAKDANNDSKIYEIKARKGGLIQLQTINRNANIIAITDNFLMFAGGEMYEYTDVLATNTIAEGIINKGIFPIIEQGWFNCHPDDAHFFSNDDSLKVYDDTDWLILFAKITDKSRDEDGIYEFGLDAYTNELWRRSYVKSYTANNTGEKQRDNLDEACDFCYRDSSIKDTTIDYSYEQDRPPMALFGLGRFMERQVGYAEPKGKVWTKAHDGLAKAPQYYKATYNFRDEVVGTSGNDIDGFDSFSNTDTNGTVVIVASQGNHKKVMKISGDGDNGAETNIYTESVVETSGTIEYYGKYIDYGVGYLSFYFLDSTNNIMLYAFLSCNNNRITVVHGDGAGGTTTIHTALTSDTYVRIRWEFDCATDTNSLWLDEVNIFADEPFYNDLAATSFKRMRLRTRANTGANAIEYYVDAIGYSWDANYSVGDNVVAWDVEKNGNLDLINVGDKPAYYVKKLGITRATCVGNTAISQTYNDATLEDGKTILPLKEYRDLRIQADAEALQIATALFNMFSKETTFVGLRVVNQEFVQPGKTVNFANAGDITVSEVDLMVLFYSYDWVNDVYELMVLTDNVVLLREFESYFDRSAIMVHQNSTAVRENATDVATNVTGIATNVTNVATNVTGIANIETWKTAQHTREITPAQGPFPQNGVTAGANNCYFSSGLIFYGLTGKASFCRTIFRLPDDYVDGTDFVIKWNWLMSGGGSAADQIDYKFQIYRCRDNDSNLLHQTIDLTVNGRRGDENNYQSTTIGGAGLTKSTFVEVRLYMEDNSNTYLSYLKGISLLIQVNGRD